MDATDPQPLTEAEAQPLDVDGVGATRIGTALWAVALVVLLFFADDLRDQGREWWLWTCVAGIGTGAMGIAYTTWRRDAIRRVRAARTSGA
jgi:hypothetical protein